MADNKEPVYPSPLPFVPRLKTLKSVRSTYARILRCLAAAEIDLETARVWVYAIATFLNIAKTATEIDIETELKKLRAEIQDIKRRSEDEVTAERQKRIG